jgi:hypothetical protein
MAQREVPDAGRDDATPAPSKKPSKKLLPKHLPVDHGMKDEFRANWDEARRLQTPTGAIVASLYRHLIDNSTIPGDN